MKKGNAYTYPVGRGLYINLTNRCTNRCANKKSSQSFRKQKADSTGKSEQKR